MLFCQLGRAHSLREIVNGLRSCEGKLKHLGITAPNRSTLSYANEHRPWELYRKVFFSLLASCRAKVNGKSIGKLPLFSSWITVRKGGYLSELPNALLQEGLPDST
ncbi:MAG: DUF4372 domain-containing protein [Proteobacteria bacterium]|nr:DUF4372 domain-containing protein [Pseudomonadota bacterium]MBU2262138.1 DUF4372 domain-containing protein [Pseudomonadota bacterium]